MPRDPSYPRPQLRRDTWELLDGVWDVALDADAAWTNPNQVSFTQSIRVPFAPETRASGIGTDQVLRRCWYRRELTVTPPRDGGRLLLHFGAVDRVATVWVDGRPVGSHVGGHTPFTVDLTDHLPALAPLLQADAPVEDLATASVAAAAPATTEAGPVEEQAEAAIAEAAASIMSDLVVAGELGPADTELLDQYPEDAAVAVAEAVVAAAADAEPAATPVTIELVVQADDQPRTMTIPRGKQDWWPEPHVIWYPRTTGIWQSVWLEEVPATRITELRWHGDASTMSVTLDAVLDGAPAIGDRVQVQLSARGRTLVDDVVTVTDVVDGQATIHRTFVIGVPGVDDPFSLIWRPHNPTLLEATLEVHRGGDAPGVAVDRVESYTALRSIEVVDGRLVLNGRPVKLRMALDQGYWPESGMTAPSIDALRRDVELIRELGLHGVRKHQKVEDPRWLALCDELGVLVWEELPSAYAFDVATVADLTREWTEVIQRDRNHPCIITWVPVNESWGVPLATIDAQQQALIRTLTDLTKALDPTRLVSANDGWETVGGDIVGIHDYEQDASVIAARYADAAALDRAFAGPGPAGRVLTADGTDRAGRAVLLTELGGATLSRDADGLFGYGNLTDADAFVDRYRSLCAATLASDVLSGFCWTQLTDTFQEANGLLTMDREPKAPLEVLRAATHGR